MPVNKKQELLDALLEAIHKVDAQVRAAIETPVEIPAAPDALALRGGSWTSKAQSGKGGAPPPPPAPGPQPGVVRVVDEDKRAVAGAGISIVDTDTGAGQGAWTTDAAGRAEIPALAISDYVVAASTLERRGSQDLVVDGRAPWSVTVAIAPAPPPPEPPGGGGGRGGIVPFGTPPPPQGRAGLAVGQPVLVFGALAGSIAALPGAPGGLYEVRLDSGLVVKALEYQLAPLTGRR